MALLELDRSERDPGLVRAAYLTAIRASHPDRNVAPDATERSARLTVAYTTVCAVLATTPVDEPRPGPAPVVEQPVRPDPVVTEVAVVVIADDTIEVAAPPDLTFAWLVQTGHVVGDVTFLDRSAALLQILVSFVDEPVCQMIFDLQGRAARGTTEVFCTIDSIEDRPAPPIVAVTRFIADHLAEVISVPG